MTRPAPLIKLLALPSPLYCGILLASPTIGKLLRQHRTFDKTLNLEYLGWQLFFTQEIMHSFQSTRINITIHQLIQIIKVLY